MTIALYLAGYFWFDFNGLSDPKPLGDSSTFDIIYGVGNFDTNKRIYLVHVCVISFLSF